MAVPPPWKNSCRRLHRPHWWRPRTPSSEKTEGQSRSTSDRYVPSPPDWMGFVGFSAEAVARAAGRQVFPFSFLWRNNAVEFVHLRVSIWCIHLEGEFSKFVRRQRGSGHKLAELLNEVIKCSRRLPHFKALGLRCLCSLSISLEHFSIPGPSLHLQIRGNWRSL